VTSSFWQHGVGRRLGAGLLALTVWALSACASAPSAPATAGGGSAASRTAMGSNPLDPWEAWNRKVFGFNEALDAAVIKPVAEGYTRLVPQPIRRGVSNFFGNFSDGWSAINNFLQGEVSLGMRDVSRVTINTFLGLGGVLDIASEAGVERQEQDFGRTLARWGVPAGPFVVWPGLGLKTVRESAGMPFDMMATPSLLGPTTNAQLGWTGLGLLDLRAELLGAGRVLDEAALDKYSFARDAYLQRRGVLTYDQDDWRDEPASPAAPSASAAK
jgi:phospholipid-binding lipoprotein MlaA